MPSALLVVFTNPASAEEEATYNAWYDDVHLADVLKVPGFVSAKRYRLSPVPAVADPAPAPASYLAIYEVEGDVEAAAKALTAVAGTPAMPIDPTMDPNMIVHYWTPID